MVELLNTNLLMTWFGHGSGRTTDDEALIGSWFDAVAAAPVQVGLYRLNAEGSVMDRIKDLPNRHPEALAGQARPDWLIIAEYAAIESALESAASAPWMEAEGGSGPRMTTRSLYRPFVYIAGPEEDGSGDLGPVIQTGTFEMLDPADDWDVLEWYRDTKFPPIPSTGGAIRARTLLAAAGATKFGVLYEFDSLESRQTNFEEVQEALALDDSTPTGQIVKRLRHAPMSPSVGVQLQYRRNAAR